jgi:hypothetical protein
MKLIILAKPQTGYIWNSEVYHGNDPELDNSAAWVVKQLLDQLTNKHRIAYVDFFYTSVTKRCGQVVNTAASYLEGPRFKSQPRHCPSRLIPQFPHGSARTVP